MFNEPDAPVGDGRVGRTVSKHSVVVKKSTFKPGLKNI